MNEENKEELTFWVDNSDGLVQGGIFVRSDLKLMFDKLKEQGIEPVGIKYDGSWNLEIITRAKL